MSRGLRITLLIHAIVCVAFGIVMYVVPGTWANLVRDALRSRITRPYAAALLGLGVGSWLGYRETACKRVWLLVQTEIVFSVLGTLAALYGGLVAGGPAFNWLALAVFGSVGVA